MENPRTARPRRRSSSSLSEFLAEQGNTFHDAFLTDQDGGRHPISKIVLATHSRFFLALFGDFPEGETEFQLRTVKRTADSAAGLAMVLHWLETGQLDLGEESVLEVLQTAEYLGEGRLSDICQQWLVGQLEPGNALGFWQCAQELFLSRLLRESWSFLVSRVEEVFREEEFLQLAAASMETLLQSNQLTCREEEVWEALERWSLAGHDRQKESSAMVATVRLGLLDLHYFKRNVRFHSLLEGELGDRAEVEVERGGLARPRSPSCLLVSLGGWTGSSSRAVHTYNTAADTWTTLPLQLPEAWCYMGSAVIGGQVYLCGGHTSSQWASRELWCLQLATGKVQRLSPMKQSRNFVATAVLGSSLYALGGKEGVESVGRLNTVEVYSRHTNQWTQIKPMKDGRSDAGAATLGGDIYVVGGFSGRTALSSVERYNPSKDRWKHVRDMSVARAGVTAAVLGGRLYVVGGWEGDINNPTRLATGEVYSPHDNRWSSLPDMITPRSNFGLLVLDGRLTAVGGYDGYQITQLVEALDLSLGRWVPLASLPAPCSGLACVSLPTCCLGGTREEEEDISYSLGDLSISSYSLDRDSLYSDTIHEEDEEEEEEGEREEQGV